MGRAGQSYWRVYGPVHGAFTAVQLRPQDEVLYDQKLLSKTKYATYEAAEEGMRQAVRDFVKKHSKAGKGIRG